MAVTFDYALLFGAMRFWQASPTLIGLVSLFLTLVGLGQALLFRGRRPRAASIIVGILSLEAGLVCVLTWEYAATRPPGHPMFNFTHLAILSVIWGTILGYIAGTVIAGVFLVADLMRQLLRRMSREKGVTVADGFGTMADSAANAAHDEQAGQDPSIWATIIGEEESAEV